MLGALQKFTVSIPILALLLILGSCSDKDQVNGPSVPKYLRGDINNNGVAYEVADAVLFTNYFIYGLGVFTIDEEVQIAATDVNKDGMTLSVADLVYITQIVIGNALPYAKITPLEVRYTHDNLGVMSVNDDVLIGAVHLVIAGQTEPVLLAGVMDLYYAFDGVNTNILVWSLDGESFTGDFLNVSGDIVSIEMATYEGQPVNTTDFSLRQNYPNPFSDETIILFILSYASDVTLKITNELEEIVFEFRQHYSRGYHPFKWNGTDKYGLIIPNGKYTCTMFVGEHKKSIEMLKDD